LKRLNYPDLRLQRPARVGRRRARASTNAVVRLADPGSMAMLKAGIGKRFLLQIDERKENGMYLSIQECIDMSDLTEDEVLAIAEHENLPEMLAVELGSYLVHSAGGEKRIKQMIQDDIREAQARGNHKHAGVLKHVLRHFVEHHATAEA
jgi:hypothetical protein